MTVKTSKRGTSTAVLLLISAILGVTILATDHNLWQFQPTHAYGLIIFVAIDISLAGAAIMRGTKSALTAAAAWGALQALIMLSDIFTPTPFDSVQTLSMTDFAKYLFGLGFYDNNHIPFLFPALFVVQLVLVVVALRESRR